MKRYVRDIKVDFMMNENVQKLVMDTIGKIEHSLDIEKDVNRASEELLNLLYEEMNCQLKLIKPKSNKKNNKLQQKSWWSGALQILWDNVCENEQIYLKCKEKGNIRQKLKSNFVQSRKTFDRAARQAKRRM